MYKILAEDIDVLIDEGKGVVSSLKIKNKECSVNNCPIFALRFRNKEGKCFYTNSTDAKNVRTTDNGILYEGFLNDFNSLCVNVIIASGTSIEWRVEITSVPQEYALEWVEFPKICLPRLIDNDPQGGKILFPYNEGMIVTNENLLPRYEMEFPSSGAYFMFPNMVCSQFFAYLFKDCGLYIGAHDTKRGLKGVDFYPYENGIAMQMRLYSGADFGMDYKPLFPVVWQACQGYWKDAADIYRSWFHNNLPHNITPIRENKGLPTWYENSPVIVTYPVRGIHDYDKMDPNALFPYTNALPHLKKIKNDTGCQIMSLLMHWEGTAPWAPPYIWPPFGGEQLFNEFRDALHESGDLLGVYCSGFGYTLKSKLIDSYNFENEIENMNVLEAVCHSPENKPELGITCTYQRVGYDICPVSKRGREIINEGFEPLFQSGVDYAQILDQNHGGGQYLCYAREHEHPPMPGEWMTENMQSLLKEWNDKNPNMIFGCESAAAEPFIGNLLMSDNRYELNYPYGTPVPVYAYLYHPYVRNFMGNQCGCPFEPKCDTLRYRLAYSFSIGDIMTLTLAPNGNLMSHWGTHDFDNPPDMEKTTLFIKNVMKFYNKDGKKYLYCGKMAHKPDVECEEITIPLFRGRDIATLPRLLSSVWEEGNGKFAYIVVNPDDQEVSFKIDNDSYMCPPLDAVLIIR